MSEIFFTMAYCMFHEITTPLFTTLWGRRAAWIVLVCFAVLCFYIGYDNVMTWREDIAAVRGKPMVVAQSPTESTKMPAISEYHLFGGAPEQSAILPITSLQLRLVGVIQAEPERFSRVIISQEGRPGVVYQVGDVLSSGVKVHQIAKDGVILDNSGRLEKLPLQRTPLQFQGMPKSLLNTTREKSPPEE